MLAMVKNVDGNLLDSKADVIFHQVNCQGVMGSGIAKQIREWCPSHYMDYKARCDNATSPRELLGKSVMTLYDRTRRLYICGIYGQLNYGREKTCYTDYGAVHHALITIRDAAIRCELKESFRFAVPYGMCCGLAGGDWYIIEEILSEVFSESPYITLEVWRLTT
jgi:hypothetical protein